MDNETTMTYDWREAVCKVLKLSRVTVQVQSLLADYKEEEQCGIQ